MRVLVADDEKNISETIVKYLKLENIEARAVSNGLSAKRILEEETFDAAIIDLKMPGLDGLGLLKWMLEEGPDIPIIMISAFGEIKDAVEAMKLGAKDYLVKPFDPEELIIRLKKVTNENNNKIKIEIGKSIEINSDNFIGKSSQIIKIKDEINKIAKTNSNLLITGESGTGKEIVARMIHQCSDRNKNNFIPVNIGGMQENLLESELFGYEKGAFTGADIKKTGMFEIASNGTIFLDEIGDMPLNMQVKLLRVIQDKKIQRLGGLTFIPINPRIISATNKNIDELVKNKLFREDLFFRINVVNIHMPPLKERKDDIPLLIGFFINKFNKIFKKNIENISKEALTHLINYNFPGNIRELENIIERAFIYCESNIITIKEIDLKIDNFNKNIKYGKLKEIEKQMIIDALHKWENNKTKASKELGITRRTLLNKIKEFGIL